MTPENPDSPSPDRVELTFDDDRPPSIAIIHAIAALEDTDPMESPAELGFRLYDQINSEALDRLFTNGEGIGDVLVDLCLYSEDRYDILIRDSGLVIAQKRD
ncbi:HalOD1 output domain-containing protein [Natrinema sp. 1APR25-10V2]|uniref:HalOD1 output domain-containing protein n=1 Tax=Natrinema sp. 1APR25-10V2 TaxID=2951081 RepID=UPI0028762AA1|nr:HalOD1 output domain-containing protein [Natrinema sp. 1APR25-10V2]MDS0476923.1 hypothetical protein [Natrinema sp. 1APR25-10V2]